MCNASTPPARRARPPRFVALDRRATRLGSVLSPRALLGGPCALLLAACAGSLAGLGGTDETIGRATHRDIAVEIPATLRRYGYAIYNNRETSSTLHIETSWQQRVPFEDEAELGADAARTRFIAQARQSGPAIYTLRLISQNEVSLPDSIEQANPVGWSRIPATDMYRAYVREISTEIELKVAAGLRLYGTPR